MTQVKVALKDIFAQARAVHFAMKNGQITYNEAKERTKPLLQLLNTKITKIAQKYGIKPKKIGFQDLGRTVR